MALLKRSITAGLLALTFAASAQAANIQLAEQKIKAGMIYNFLKYTDWPAANATAPMRVCIFGDDPLGGNLKPMQGRTVNQRPIAVQAIAAANDAASCDILLVGAQGQSQWPALRAAIANRPIMTIGEGTDFIRQGGMLAFGHKENRIAVTLNMDAAETAQLNVQPRLLNLVSVTRGGSGEQ